MAEDDIVVVTGGAGFLGQHIVKMLQTRTKVSEIRVFDRNPYKNNLDHTERVPVKSIIGDLGNVPELNKAFQGASAVIHTAGIVSVSSFPDYEGMKKVNVEGTANVIQSCLEQSISRLVYTATADVAIGFDEIQNGTEFLPYPDEFLYDGYAGTKAQAEKMVKAANGKELSNGEGRLLTVSMRPPVMYGEEDQHFIPIAIKNARKSFGVIPRIGSGKAMFQNAYVGNVAWCHVLACMALKTKPQLGGRVYFATDDTPVVNSFEFLRPFLLIKGCRVANIRIPYPIIYVLFYCLEILMRCIRPFVNVNLDTGLRSMIFINTSLYFNSKKAAKELGYKPLYEWNQSKEISLKYYDQVDI